MRTYPASFVLLAGLATIPACTVSTLVGTDGHGGGASSGGGVGSSSCDTSSSSTSSGSGVGGSSSSTTSTSSSSTSSGCIDLDPSKFDQSCKTDDDCIDVAAGTLCAAYECSCAGGTIAAAAAAQYNALYTSVPPAPGPGCSCPITGTGRCIVGQCVWCPAGFTDGGYQFVCPGDGG